MIARKEAENLKSGPVDLNLISFKIFVSGYKLDAKASFEKDAIKMWGDYNGIDFKMTLRSNGYVWFELGHKRFNYPIDSSSAEQFKQFLWETRADHDEVKGVLSAIWNSYNERVVEKTMVSEKVPYNKIGHFNFYLDTTMNFSESLLRSKVTIEGNAQGHKLDGVRASFASLYRKLS